MTTFLSVCGILFLLCCVIVGAFILSVEIDKYTIRKRGKKAEYIRKIVRYELEAHRVASALAAKVTENKCGLCVPDKPCNFENCPNDE